MSSGRGLKAVIGALVATTSYALVERGRAADAWADSSALEAELDDARRRLRELRNDVNGDGSGGGDATGSGKLEDVLGGGPGAWRNAWGRMSCSPAAASTTYSRGLTILAPRRLAASRYTA